MARKKALIIGITGQDGAYLAEYLVAKNYEVHGIKRRSSLFNTQRIDHLYEDRHVENRNLHLHYGDLSDATNLIRIIGEVKPQEIYNLGAMSHVKVSFDSPEYTANVDGLGALRVLEAVRILKLESHTKVYQASSSEMYGATKESPQNEDTPFSPRSPYGVAKLYAYWITVNYREAHNLFASNGILFNHESPLRGETFVTRKITRAISDMALGGKEILYIGNLNARRDWGHAQDYVKAMHLILQHNKPDDFVIATGQSISVREFIIKAFLYLNVQIEFNGKGSAEEGRVISSSNSEYSFKQGQVVVKVDPFYYRPTEVDYLLGDASKAQKVLGWKPEITLDTLISNMLESDLELARKNKHLGAGGFKIHKSYE